MLKFTKKSQLKKEKEQEQEKKRLEEISKIVQEVSVIERKYSLKFAIKKLSEKKSLTKQESKILDAMLAMLDTMHDAKNEAEQNDLKPEFEPSVSLVPTELNQAKNQEIKITQTPTSGVEVTDELAKKLAKQRELVEQDTKNTENPQTNNLTFIQQFQSVKLKPLVKVQSEQTQKSKKKSEDQKTELTEKSEEVKLINTTVDEGQFMQKNVDTDLKQNSDDDSFLLQQIKATRKQLTNKQTTVQEDNLPCVKSELIDSAEEKKILDEKKEQDLFNFAEVVCDRIDLSEKERQEIFNFRERVDDVKLRFRDEAYKKPFESTVSKIVEEISRPNSILDGEFFNNLKTINDFIKGNPTQQQPQTPVSSQFKPHNKHKAVIVEMIPKPKPNPKPKL